MINTISIIKYVFIPIWMILILLTYLNLNNYFGSYFSLILLLSLVVFIFLNLRNFSEPPIIVLVLSAVYFSVRQILHIELPILLVSHLPQPSFYEITRGNILIILGLVFFFLGYITLRKKQPNFSEHNQMLKGSEVYLLWLLFLFSLSSIVLIFAINGANLAYLQAYAQDVLKSPLNSLLYTIYLSMPIFACGLAFHYKQIEKKYLGFIILVFTALTTFILARREPLIFLLLGTLIIYQPKINFTNLLKPFLIVCSIGFLIFFLVYLRVSSQLSSEIPISFFDFIFIYAISEEFWTYDILLVIFTEAGSYSMPFRNGIDLTPKFVDNFFPYEFPEEALDEIIGQDYKPALRAIVGTPFTIFGATYLNFGIFGLCFGMFLVGLVAKFINIFKLSSKNIVSFLLTVILFSAFFFLIRNADIYNVFLMIVKNFIIVIIPFLTLKLAKIWITR